MTNANDGAPDTDVVRLCGGARALVRPIRPPDADTLQAYVRGLSPESRHRRFLGTLNELSSRELDRVIRMDSRDRLALIVETIVGGAATTIGEARYVVGPDGLSCEFGMSVADAWQHKGVGTALLASIECRVRGLGVRYLMGEILHGNRPMQRLARRSGFAMTVHAGDARLVHIVKDLAASAPIIARHEQAAAALRAA